MRDTIFVISHKLLPCQNLAFTHSHISVTSRGRLLQKTGSQRPLPPKQ
uniref:Uncharacterized protein n=1 Tax=Oreochromis aureus TaxID=47969 RepID=A0AAZ1XSG1_OREAU